MYDVMKWIANAFRIKCSKYKPEELTPELCDSLFGDAFNEYCVMNTVNQKASEGWKNEDICH